MPRITLKKYFKVLGIFTCHTNNTSSNTGERVHGVSFYLHEMVSGITLWYIAFRYFYPQVCWNHIKVCSWLEDQPYKACLTRQKWRRHLLFWLSVFCVHWSCGCNSFSYLNARFSNHLNLSFWLCARAWVWVWHKTLRCCHNYLFMNAAAVTPFLKKWFMTQLSVSLWRQLQAMNGYYMHALSQ